MLAATLTMAEHELTMAEHDLECNDERRMEGQMQKHLLPAVEKCMRMPAKEKRGCCGAAWWEKGGSRSNVGLCDVWL